MPAGPPPVLPQPPWVSREAWRGQGPRRASVAGLEGNFQVIGPPASEKGFSKICTAGQEQEGKLGEVTFFNGQQLLNTHTPSGALVSEKYSLKQNNYFSKSWNSIKCNPPKQYLTALHSGLSQIEDHGGFSGGFLLPTHRPIKPKP